MVAEEEDLPVVVIATEVAVKAAEILNLEEAIALLNLEEEDLIDLQKAQAQEEALSLVIQEAMVPLQEEEEAEKRTLLVL